MLNRCFTHNANAPNYLQILPMATISSAAMGCDVPALSDILRFSIAAHRGMTEWIYFLQLAEWQRRGKPRRLPAPCVGATVAEDLLTHGPALWDRARSAFAEWYDGVYGGEEHFLAEHRFWALLCLRDQATESILQLWIGQEQPFLLSPMLLTAAAQARLTLHPRLDGRAVGGTLVVRLARSARAGRRPRMLKRLQKSKRSGRNTEHKHNSVNASTP